MRSRPIVFTWQCAFLCLLALSFPLQIMVLFGHSALEFHLIAAKLAPCNWIVIGLCLASAWAAWRASPVLLALLPLLALAVIYNNWIVASSQLNYGAIPAWLSGIACATLVAWPVTRRKFRDLLFKPDRRWWLTPHRHSLYVPVRLKVHLPEGSHEYLAMTYDLSEGGAFIPLGMMEPTRESVACAPPEKIRPGTQCYVSLPLRGLNRISCRAEIVRNARPRGRYPAGLGIRFLGLGWRARAALETYIEYRAAQGPSKAASVSDLG